MKPQLRWLIFSGLALTALACGSLCGGITTAGSTPSIDMSTPESPAPDHFTWIRIYEADDKLGSQLAREAKRAVAEDRRPFLYVYADWCGPCQSLHASLTDARMVDAFDGTYIILANLDEWRSQLDSSKFEASAIPAFFELDEAGAYAGRMITGAAWGEDIPENMAPPLKAFFTGHSG